MYISYNIPRKYSIIYLDFTVKILIKKKTHLIYFLFFFTFFIFYF